MSVYQSELESHLEKYAGPIEFRFENLLLVRATPQRACHVVVTTDLSNEAMPAPKGEWKWAELCALLPLDWPLDPEIWQNDPNFAWPMRELQRLADFSRQNAAWLGFGHSIPNGEPPQPFGPNTKQCASFLLPPMELPEKFARLRLSDNEILNFWTIVPIYRDELAVKVNQKAPSLIEKLSSRGVSDIINPTRPSVFDKDNQPKTARKWIFGQ
ncbi:MAG TPA: suppressor of fused domain protein [Abditibacterium sp.]|jgi:hypothetical protein